MKEIGGYIEFEHYGKKMLHDDGIKLNCGRNALAYIIEAYDVRKILMPKFMCDSCNSVLERYGVSIRYYSIGFDFKPIIGGVEDDEWLYVVNFYGQLSREFLLSLKVNGNLIVDNAQAYFEDPIEGIPTLYTCRKFFGVADGAILFADKKVEIKSQDESFDRMRFLLGRFERSASEFYPGYAENNHFFLNAPIKKMSALTENLLRGIDYNDVCEKRTNNYAYLDNALGTINKLMITVPNGPFMYPLYIDSGDEIRKKLIEKNIYIPTLWPAVFTVCTKNEIEYKMAQNILPLPVDQRYEREDMEYVIEAINMIL